MSNLISDLSTLTGIGRYNLEELVNKAISIINHDVVESRCNKETVTSVNIGIGELLITVVDDVAKFKFIPSKKLEKAIVDAYTSRESKLCLEVDEALGKRIENTYKDLF